MNFILQPCISHVLSNIKNISELSLYANKRLFQHYPDFLNPKELDSLSIFIIVHQNMMFLSDEILNDVDNIDIKYLSQIPCIPVYCDLLNNEKEKMVLVEPSCVIAQSESVKQFHSYLHHLPSEFKNCLSLLEKIGVCCTLKLRHIQSLLQTVFTVRQGKKLVNPNVMESVKKALIELKHLLAAGSDMDYASLTPLYLPNSSDELTLSTNMIYGDTHQYLEVMEIDLSGTKYSHFNITKEKYGIDAEHLCRILPDAVKPLKMSIVCKKLSRDCIPIAHSEALVKPIRSILCETNASVIYKLFNKFFTVEEFDDALEDILKNFFSSLDIITMKELNTQLVMRQSNKVICEQKSDFFIETGDYKSTLYIDCQFDDEDEILDEIVEQLHVTVSSCFHNGLLWEENTKLFKMIKKYLKAETVVKKENLLTRLQIKGIVVKPLGEIELGEEIPESYRPWLDQNPYNIFQPMEYVGYEDREGHIIYARVVRLVSTSERGRDHLQRVYYIHYSSEPDTQGKEVPLFDLYKFITDTKELDDIYALIKLFKEGNIAEIKESLYKELGVIWKLDPEARNKVIKRLFMYLEWHPDESSDDLERRQDITTYLREQIEILEKETTGSNSDDDSASIDDPSTACAFQFSKWNSDAHSYRHAYQNNSTPFSGLNVSKSNPDEGRRWVKQAEVDYAAGP